MPMRYINQDEVFAVIEQRFRGPLSLSDVAEAVHLSPGHLQPRYVDKPAEPCRTGSCNAA
jgi:AraC-like DNA-binding protein